LAYIRYLDHAAIAAQGDDTGRASGVVSPARNAIQPMVGISLQAL